MEKCDKTGIKAWWSGRHPENKRIDKYCPCNEWHNLEKELKNETENQNPAVRDASEKCTVVTKKTRENGLVFIEDSWERWLWSSGYIKKSNNKLYKITGTKPLSITITKRRWRLLGHILRLLADCPARNAVRYYFEERTKKIFRGRKRSTIVSTLNEDIKRTKGDYITFPVTPLVS